MKAISIFIIFLSIVACRSTKESFTSNEEKPAIAIGDNSQNTLDWNGTYSGTMPCADCEGIKTLITLNSDLTCKVSRIYMGESNNVFTDSGTFSWDETKSKITLQLENDDKKLNQYLVGENVLIKLDVNGKLIESNLSEMYQLSKIENNSNLTNKHWTLFELNGELIDTSRDPHLILHTEENRVTGNGGCNSFSGNYWLEENSKIIFSQLLSTKKYCLDVDYENRFMNVLQETNNYSLDGDTLTFYNRELIPLAKLVYNP